MNITKHSQIFAIFMIAWFPISILYLHAVGVGGGQGDLNLAFCLFVILWALGQDRDQSKQSGDCKGVRIENLLFIFSLFFIYRIITSICLYVFHVQANATYFEDNARTDVSMIALYIFLVVAGPLLEEFIFRKCLWNELKKFGLVCTVIVTSVAFMLLHDPGVRIHALGGGIIYGIILIITNDFKMCFFYHVFNNTSAFMFYKDAAGTQYDFQKMIILSSAGAVITSVFILANKKYRTALKGRWIAACEQCKNEFNELRENQKTKRYACGMMCSAAAVLIAIATGFI